jgi:hypothetical protein
MRDNNGERPVADKATFSQDEWNKLLESVMMAGISVTAADPSGLWGLMKEGMTTGWALLEAKNTGTNELIKAVADGFGEAEGRSAARDEVRAKFSGAKFPEVKEKAIATLREAAAIVDAKAPSDAPAFKSWLQQIAQKTAEASTEGGFLGFGGIPVSDAEKATLAEVSAALAVKAQA